MCIDADMVFVLEIFEFYHGYEGYIYPWYRPIVDAFKTITEQGKSVYFLEGNHEFDMALSLRATLVFNALKTSP